MLEPIIATIDDCNKTKENMTFCEWHDNIVMFLNYHPPVSHLKKIILNAVKDDRWQDLYNKGLTPFKAITNITEDINLTIS